MSDGFGWNFYGFFLVAAAWCAGYFVWAVTANRRDARRRARDNRGVDVDGE